MPESPEDEARQQVLKQHRRDFVRADLIVHWPSHLAVVCFLVAFWYALLFRDEWELVLGIATLAVVCAAWPRAAEARTQLLGIAKDRDSRLPTDQLLRSEPQAPTDVASPQSQSPQPRTRQG